MAALLAAAFGMMGCSADQHRPVTLTMAHIDDETTVLDPAVGWFVEEVEDASDGRLRIEVEYGCCGGGRDVERELVAGVAAGEWDLGWVGTRVFHDLGFTAYAPLTAPLVLGGYGVQQAVLADTELVTGLGEGLVDDLGVEPVAVLPGPLRKPLAVKPLWSAADWSGLRAYHFPAELSAATYLTLGAEPVTGSFTERDEALGTNEIDIIEAGLSFHSGGRREFVPYGMVNVNLWPRVSALIADPESLGRLSAEQRGWMADAAARVVDKTPELGQIDAGLIEESCEWGARYPSLSPEQLEAFRTAVTPVSDALDNDPALAATLDRIAEIGEETGQDPALPIPADCTGEAPPPPSPGNDDPSVLAGTFETRDWTADALLAAGADPEDAADFGTFDLTFTDGAFRLVNALEDDVFECHGDYSVESSTVVVRIDPGPCGSGGELFSAVFDVEAESLSLSDVEAPHPIDEVIFGAEPLTRVS